MSKLIKMKKIKKGVFLDQKKSIIYKTIDSNANRSIEVLKKEYQNQKKLYEMDLPGKIKIPEPIGFHKKEERFNMKYIKGKNLKYIVDPSIYEEFGRELKKLHKKQIFHSHLEVQDVIFKDGYFYILDLIELNKKSRYYDLARFKISIYLYQLKNIWKYNIYNQLASAFTKGYNPDKKLERKYLYKVKKNIMDSYKRKNIIGKIKSLVMKTFLEFKIEK